MGASLAATAVSSGARWRASLLAATLFAVGCGGASASAQPAAADPQAVPLTDADPPTWAPRASDAPHTGAAVGLATSGGYDQARGVVIRLMRALRDTSQNELEQLLSEALLHTLPFGARRPAGRDALIQRLLHLAPSLGLMANTPVEALIDTSSLEVTPLARRFTDQPLPTGLQASDLLVTFRLGPAGSHFLSQILGWRNQGAIVVRPGLRPVVVAL